MNKLYGLLTIALSILLLSGCTIPLADGGKIEISTDGININQGDANAEESPDESDEKIDQQDEKENDVNQGDGLAENDKGGGRDDIDGLGGCQNEFYLLVNRLPKGFPIQECAFIEYLELFEDEETNSKVILASITAYESLDDEIDKYEQYFKSNGYSPTVESEAAETRIAIKENDMDITVKLPHSDNDFINTQIYYTESPIKEYKFTESIINYTEKGYGQCSDEYYTLLGVLTDDFPLPECAHIQYLTIEYFEGGMQITGIYQTNRFWIDEYTELDTYFNESSFAVERSESFTTHGEIYFDQVGISGGIDVVKHGMDATVTTVFLSKSFDD